MSCASGVGGGVTISSITTQLFGGLVANGHSFHIFHLPHLPRLASMASQALAAVRRLPPYKVVLWRQGVNLEYLTKDFRL